MHSWYPWTHSCYPWMHSCYPWTHSWYPEMHWWQQPAHTQQLLFVSSVETRLLILSLFLPFLNPSSFSFPTISRHLAFFPQIVNLQENIIEHSVKWNWVKFWVIIKTQVKILEFHDNFPLLPAAWLVISHSSDQHRLEVLFLHDPDPAFLLLWQQWHGTEKQRIIAS